MYTTNKLNGWQSDQCSGAEVQVNNFELLDAIALNILNKVKGKTDRYGNSYSVATVVEQNPQIFSWLDLMDLNVWIILALMVSVAGVTMISGLLIIILERTQMIGILKARSDTPHLPMVCYFHYWKRIAVGQYYWFRTSILAKIYRTGYARP